VLARVAEEEAEARVRESVAVHPSAAPRHLRDGRLELHHVHALDARHVGQPPRGGAGAESHHEDAPRGGVQQRAQQARHDLRARVVARVAVHLAVHHEGEAGRADECDAALATLPLPDDRAPLLAQPVLGLVGPKERVRLDAPGADPAVAEGGRGPRRGEEEDDARPDREGGEPGREAPARVEDRRRQAEGEEERGHEAPGAGRAQQRQEAEAAGQRPEDRAAGVGGGGPADVAAHSLAAPAEERHEQGELHARDEGRGDHHEGRHQEPAEHVAGEGDVAERPQHDREERQAVAEGEADGDRGGLQEAGHREGEEGGRSVAAHERVGQAAEADAQERRGEDEAEGEHRPPEQRREDPVPDELEQEERKAHRRARGEDEPARGGPLAGRGRRGRPRGGPGVGLDPAGEEEGRERDAEVHRAGCEQRAAVAEALEAVEGREERPRHGAQGVRPVEERGGAPPGVPRALDLARRRGQRAAHEHGGHEEDEGREQEADERREEVAEGQAAPEREIGGPRRRQQEGVSRGEEGDRRLEARVERERPRVAVGPWADEERAGAEAADEEGEHRRGGARRVAEHEAQLARPHELVGESAGARADEEEGDGEEARRHAGAATLTRERPAEQPGPDALCFTP
jgi:hypothetical protein